MTRRELPQVGKTVKMGRSQYRIFSTEHNGSGVWLTRLVRISGRGKAGATIVADAREVVAAMQ